MKKVDNDENNEGSIFHRLSQTAKNSLDDIGKIKDNLDDIEKNKDNLHSLREKLSLLRRKRISDHIDGFRKKPVTYYMDIGTETDKTNPFDPADNDIDNEGKMIHMDDRLKKK